MKIKEEYKGQIVGNSRVPRVVVSDIKDFEIQYYQKMGFGFLFEKETPKVEKVKKETKIDLTNDIVE